MTDLMTVPAAAERLGISRTSAWRLVKRGLIASHAFPVGGVRIATADLENFIARCRLEPVRRLSARKAKVRTAGDFAARTKRVALQAVRMEANR